MAGPKKGGGTSFHIINETTKEYLVSYEMGLKWRFHAFMGDSFESEALAKKKLENGLKTGAIPQGTYKITC